MADEHYSPLVEGTSALKPDCSRYSNENELIISFQEALNQQGRGEAPQDLFLDQLHIKILYFLRSSQFITDLRNGSLRGRISWHQVAPWKIALAGLAYLLFSICVILIGV